MKGVSTTPIWFDSYDVKERVNTLLSSEHLNHCLQSLLLTTPERASRFSADDSISDFFNARELADTVQNRA